MKDSPSSPPWLVYISVVPWCARRVQVRGVSEYTIGRLIGQVRNLGKRLCPLLDRAVSGILILAFLYLLPMIAPEVLDLVVDSYEAICSFTSAVGFRAVDELLLVRRSVMSGHVCLAGKLSGGLAVRV
jgi:hypothetical protein